MHNRLLGVLPRYTVFGIFLMKPSCGDYQVKEVKNIKSNEVKGSLGIQKGGIRNNEKTFFHYFDGNHIYRRNRF
jgi:hypothetical protein